MNSSEAFARGEAARRAGVKTKNIFDWKKARELIEEHGAKEAYAGLQQDWEWTGGRIWSDGKPDMDSYTYLQSIWAIPEIQFDDGPKIPCYTTVLREDVTWYASDKWPYLPDSQADS